MKRRIQDAYDSIRLSETSKEKIWEDIMDSQKPGYRTVQKKIRSQKWSVIPVAAVLAVLIAVGSFLGVREFSGKDTPNVAPDPTGNILTAPVDPTCDHSSTVIIDYELEYADVPESQRDHVILYAKALYENWPQEKWERTGLSMQLYQVKDRVDCGFVLKDLNRDGLADLLIYGGSQLYQICITDKQGGNRDPQVLNCIEFLFPREPYQEQAEMSLCQDDVIMFTSVLNDRDIYISYYRFGMNEFGSPCLDMIETVFAIDGTEWFAGPDEENAVPISAEEAENIIARYKPEEVEPRIFYRIEVYVLNYHHQFEGVDERYKPLLMTYGKAMCEGWSQSRWIEAGLSLEVFQVQSAYWTLEYALLDMDGNGDEELLIFGEDQLYALYVLRDDVPDERLEWTIHHNAERLSIQLCEDNVIKVVQKDPTGATDTSFYRVGKDGVGDISLVMVNNVLQTPEGQWYAGPNAKDAVAVTESEAQALIASYVPVEIEGTPMLNKVRIE